MQKIGPNIDYFIARITGDQDQARISYRAHQVRSRYREVMQVVYGPTADLFLAHTNNVYIMNKNDVRTLIVYVDESIFSAELNAQRELIRLKFLEMFGEDLGSFEIYVSRGRYKANHPFIPENDPILAAPYVPAKLDSNEEAYVGTTAAALDDIPLRKSFEKAMSASMALNKAEKVKSE